MTPLNEIPQIKYWNELTWTTSWMCLRHQTGFYFIFIPFHLCEWYHRRVLTGFWILNELVMAGMAFQSSSESRLCPHRSPARGFSRSWNKRSRSCGKCQAIQNSLVLGRKMWGCDLWEPEVTQRPVLGMSHILSPFCWQTG